MRNSTTLPVSDEGTDWVNNRQQEKDRRRQKRDRKFSRGRKQRKSKDKSGGRDEWLT